MNKTLTEALEEYILSGAQSLVLRGSIPVNVWAMGEQVRKGVMPFDGVYGDGNLAALTRPLKTRIGTYHPDWAGFLTRSFRAIRLPKTLAPPRPNGSPMRDDVNKKGRTIPRGNRRPIFYSGRQKKRSPFPKYVIECHAGGNLAEAKRGLDLKTYLVSSDGEKFTEFYPNGKPLDFSVGGGDDRPNSETIKYAIGVQVFTEYCWTVELQFDHGVAPILFPVHERAARRIVAQAKSANEGERKKRILHFVRAHTRQLPEDFKRDKARVMHHLRGEQIYLWQGCRMKVMPPVNSITDFRRETEKVIDVREKTYQSQ
jgi:hypothetical protein